MVYDLGARVRTTVDAPAMDWQDTPGSPAGSLGTVVAVHSAGAYGILLDNDPHRLAADFTASELAPA